MTPDNYRHGYYTCVDGRHGLGLLNQWKTYLCSAGTYNPLLVRVPSILLRRAGDTGDFIFEYSGEIHKATWTLNETRESAFVNMYLVGQSYNEDWLVIHTSVVWA